MLNRKLKNKSENLNNLNNYNNNHNNQNLLIQKIKISKF